VRTYDNRGRLLGDTAAAPTPSAPVAAPPVDLSVLLRPPLVYFLAIGIGIAAYIYERNRT
jgi:hypothetical protein